ncbi:MAG TPA: hypothetical protein VG868_10905 [Casimicrobiaceae bacterium]|jgi:hypothetical protein|nr:hypothetical protein [Casimicrobiaceae bacterium]
MPTVTRSPLQRDSARVAEARLTEFVAKFSPEHQRVIRAVRKRLRQRFKGANELVYDNYNFFVIGYSPTERPSDAIVSMACGSNGVGLCFLHGAKLPDPTRILTGSGKQTRFIHLDTPSLLGRDDVEALMAEAIARSKAPLSPANAGRLIIRSVSAKQRPRRKG